VEERGSDPINLDEAIVPDIYLFNSHEEKVNILSAKVSDRRQLIFLARMANSLLIGRKYEEDLYKLIL
jgi:hypothetical protein